jgi:hypothetical protein
MHELINLIKTNRLKLFVTPKSKTPYLNLDNKLLCNTELKKWGFYTIEDFIKWYLHNGFKVYSK